LCVYCVEDFARAAVEEHAAELSTNLSGIGASEVPADHA
jgi:hypothetical protein